MALSNPWNARSQIVAHKAQVAQRPVLGMSPNNDPEGFFIYSRARTIGGIRDVNDEERTADLILQKEEEAGEITAIHVLGIQFMCPRCDMGLLVPGIGYGKAIKGAEDDTGINTHEIIVHWDKMTQAQVDGQWRPLVTVVGAVACDYSWHEINGIPHPPDGVQSNCGWVGVLEEGRLYDHTKQGSSLVLPAGTTV